MEFSWPLELEEEEAVFSLVNLTLIFFIRILVAEEHSLASASLLIPLVGEGVGSFWVQWEEEVEEYNLLSLVYDLFRVCAY